MSLAPALIEGAPPRSVDLIIIGAGIAGAASAFYAARAGLDVLVVERRAEIASLTTAAATGAFRLQHDNADELALVRESLDAQIQAVSGVSIDEESINMLSYQRQFQAAARYIATIDETLQTLLSII